MLHSQVVKQFHCLTGVILRNIFDNAGLTSLKDSTEMPALHWHKTKHSDSEAVNLNAIILSLFCVTEPRLH